MHRKNAGAAVAGTVHYIVLNTSRASVPVQWGLTAENPVSFLDEPWVDRLDATRRQLLWKLRATARGPGRIYLLKAFLPWFLPRVERVVVVDFDLLCLEPLPNIEREFDRFDYRQLIGAVRDVAHTRLYPNSTYGVNGGVVLMRLDRMRIGAYEDAMWRVAESGHRLPIGYLGDQTLYTYVHAMHPWMLYRLSCRFNRQLSTHFALPARAYECGEGCTILHGNQPKWKPVLREWQHTTLRRGLRHELPMRLWSAFANCY